MPSWGVLLLIVAVLVAGIGIGATLCKCEKSDED
jgi:hypothetical protein